MSAVVYDPVYLVYNRARDSYVVDWLNLHKLVWHIYSLLDTSDEQDETLKPYLELA